MKKEGRASTGSARTALAWTWCIFSAAAPAASPLVGTYTGNQTEIAAGLRLKADGTFDYGLAYGALDERASGTWVERDGKVLLTTAPAPKAPAFTVVSDTPSKDGKLHVAMDKPDALGGFTVTVRVMFDGIDRPLFIEADEDGTVPLPPGRAPASVVPDLPVYDVAIEPYRLKDAARSIVFHFEPNDLGVADFRDEPLTVENGTLMMRRYDRTLTFRKESK